MAAIRRRQDMGILKKAGTDAGKEEIKMYDEVKKRYGSNLTKIIKDMAQSNQSQRKLFS